MKVFRLCKSKYSKDLSGKGAETSGGRWNSQGKVMIYTSESRALCTAEIAVHTPLGIIPDNYCLVTIEIPDDSISEMDNTKLPSGWKSFPHTDSTRQIGDQFVSEGKHLVLKAPSAVIQDEYNFLINPNHRDFYKVKILSIEPFQFDKRLFK